MGEAVNAVGRFPSTPVLEVLQGKFAGQLSRDTMKAVQEATNGRDALACALIQAQAHASADAITRLGPMNMGKVSPERWEEIEISLRMAFEIALSEAKGALS